MTVAALRAKGSPLEKVHTGTLNDLQFSWKKAQFVICCSSYRLSNCLWLKAERHGFQAVSDNSLQHLHLVTQREHLELEGGA